MTRKSKTPRSGRPPKFGEPRRPVTMTLPVRILDQLARLDSDRAKAVVEVTEAVMQTDDKRSRPVDLVEMAPGKSLIVVRPSNALKMIPWLNLIEISPARFLLSVQVGTPIEALEVALLDLLRNKKKFEHHSEYLILQGLADLIGCQRRNLQLSKEEILIINKR